MSYTYDALGRTLTKTSSNDSVSYSYDAFGRVIAETENGRTKNYTYDANSNVTNFTLNNADTQEQSIAYTYDDINRLTSMTADGKIFTYAYDAVGNLTQKSTGNLVTNYSYNEANMITALENLSGAQTLNRYTYGYSVDGNRISDIEEGGISKSYSYDGLGRLINETQTQDGVSAGYTYGYNAAGNRTSMSVTGEESYTVSYAYDANNRLTAQNKTIGTSVETTNYSYDPNGNLIAEWNSGTVPKSGAEPTLSIGVVGKDSTGAKLYEYDSRNRLVRAAGDFGTAEYAYNVNGLRKSKTVNGTTTGFIWNGMNMIAETSGNTISASYAYDITGIAMSKQNGAYQYYLKNAHGDVTGLSNGSGTLIQSYAYDAFGNQLNADDTDANPFRYAGEYYDTETGSIYLRARYYNSTTGRFISEDTYWNTKNMIYGDNPTDNPVPDVSAIIQSGNLYVYCRNNPVNRFDSTGLKDIEQTLYEMNSEYEIWGFIYGQGNSPTKNMQYGTHYVDYNGCELISIYNTLFQLGDRHALAGIIYDARKTKGVTWGPGALFGSHPDKLGLLLDKYGHSYTSTQNRAEFNGMLEVGGTYIVSFWNAGFANGIHTVMFNMVSEKKIEVYNYNNSATTVRSFYASGDRSALDVYLS